MMRYDIISFLSLYCCIQISQFDLNIIVKLRQFTFAVNTDLINAESCININCNDIFSLYQVHPLIPDRQLRLLKSFADF